MSSTHAKKDKSSHSKKEKPKLSKKARRKRMLKTIAILAGVLFLAFIITAGSVFAYFVKDLPDPQKLIQRRVAETTKIYDRTGKVVLYEIHGEQNRSQVNIKELPDYVKNASVAIEDSNFYNHKGISVTGILRSVFVDVIEKRKAQGGSTITQQLVKEAILTTEKSYDRKIKEIILALEIERKFSKEEILQLYLNEIPYGSNAYGIHAASETFFNKEPKDLTVAQSALLAALPNRPTYYSPYGAHKDDLKARQQLVITKMEEQGYITHDQAEAAKTEELAFADRNDSGIIAPHLVFYIREQLEETYGSKALEQDGLKIISTLDYNLQLKAEKAVSDNIPNIRKYGGDNAALAAVDPKRGEILAMVGSKDYFNAADQGNVNAAARPLQPGSSFKPYVYATAFAKGFTPDTIIYDVNTDFGGGYKPQNYDKSQHGPLRIKNTLPMSLNVPAVKVGYLVGPAEVAATARKMGVEDLKEGGDYGLSTSIGSHEIKLVDHVGAFGVFANQGKKIPKTAVLKVLDNKGKVLEEHLPEKIGEQVIDANIANTINNILSDNTLRAPTFGPHSPLVLSRPAAAKTGTTNDFKDAWTVGFTPNLVAGVWAGNTNGTKMKAGSDGVFVAAPVWHEFMEDALKDMPVEQFVKPSPLKATNPYLKGAKEVEKEVKLCKPSLKLATEACPPDLLVTKKYSSTHSELFYIDRSNPSGPSPKNPEKDPLFKNFEAPVLAWAKAHGETTEEIPTETDELHNKDKWPTVSISSPSDNETINSGPVNVAATIKAPLGVQKAEFFLDSSLFATDTKSPFSASFNPNNSSNGFHKIRVRVTDTAGNVGDSTITIKISVSRETPSVSMLQPSSTSTISQSAFPYTVSAQVSNMPNLSEIKFYYKDSSSGNSYLIGSVTTPSASGQYAVQWTEAPSPNTYFMYANAIDSNGNVSRSNTTTLVVN